MIERARGPVQVEKTREVGGSPFVRETKSSLHDAKVVLHKPENASEVVPFVVHISPSSVSGDHHQRHPEAVLVIPLPLVRQ